MATTAAIALGAGCSAADPGEIPYRAPPPRPKPASTGSVVATGDASDDGAVFQTPYVMGSAKLSSTQPKHAENLDSGLQNPAGHSCVTECHSDGGVAEKNASNARYSIGGTVYTDPTGATPVPAGVEVRVRNPNGVATSAFTDENGNFFVRVSEFEVQAGATVGLRDATNTMLMISSLAAGAPGGGCANPAGNACHSKGAVGGVLRIHN